MARRKHPSRLNQAVTRWLDRQPPDGAVARMAYCTGVSFVLQEKHPGWYYAITVGILVMTMLPFLLFVGSLLLLGHHNASDWLEQLFFSVGSFASIIAGFSSFGMFCIPIEVLCRWLLRKSFPHGFELPFYPGHRFTLLFLGGFGGLSALCALGIHFL